jgi:hypothetical protein
MDPAMVDAEAYQPIAPLRLDKPLPDEEEL